jgi:hypothetical protein
VPTPGKQKHRRDYGQIVRSGKAAVRAAAPPCIQDAGHSHPDERDGLDAGSNSNRSRQTDNDRGVWHPPAEHAGARAAQPVVRACVGALGSPRVCDSFNKRQFLGSSTQPNVNRKHQGQEKSSAKVDPAHPGPYHFRSEIVEPKGGRDQHHIERRHNQSRDAILAALPRPQQVHGNESAQQQQGQHRRATVDHQHVGSNLLPDVIAGNILLPIRHEPDGARQEQDRKGQVDRQAK